MDLEKSFTIRCALQNTEEHFLRLEKELLLYMDSENLLEDFVLLSLKYNEKVKSYLAQGIFIPAFRYELKLDLLRLQEMSGSLFSLFISEPELAVDLAKEVCLCILNEFLHIKNLAKSDMEVLINLTSIPSQLGTPSTYCMPASGLKSVQGVLLSQSILTGYIRSTVYSCKVESCPGSNGKRCTSNSTEVCEDCLGSLNEDIRSQEMGEEIFCQLIHRYYLQESGRHQAIKVRIRAELCSEVNLRLGNEYRITGKRAGDYFEAWEVEEWLPSPVVLMQIPNAYPVALPENISKLYLQVREICPGSPWAFAIAISSLLGSNLFPCTSYLHLKIGLMLSLASQKSNECPIPIVAIGADTFAPQKLFHIAGQLAERYIAHTASHSHLGGTIKHGSHPETIWHEAGPLLLATNGVCNLGDWAKFKKHEADYICQTVESSSVMLNNKTGKNLICSVPLRAAVWTYWCHITTRKSDQLMLRTLIEVFGMPFLTDEKSDIENEKVCRKILKDATGRTASADVSQNCIPSDELRDFFLLINSRTMTVDESASELIKNYFVASRRDRPECLPIKAIKAVTSLAEAHARLALRTVVLPEDVVAVVFFYQEAISTLFKESSTIPTLKLRLDGNESVFEYMDKQLKESAVWLEQYVKSLLSFPSN